MAGLKYCYFFKIPQFIPINIQCLEPLNRLERGGRFSHQIRENRTEISDFLGPYNGEAINNLWNKVIILSSQLFEWIYLNWVFSQLLQRRQVDIMARTWYTCTGAQKLLKSKIVNCFLLAHHIWILSFEDWCAGTWQPPSWKLLKINPKSDTVSFAFILKQRYLWNIKWENKASKVLIFNKNDVFIDVCSLREAYVKYILLAYLNFHSVS